MAAIDLDPTVKRSWRDLRAYWQQVRGPCARCGHDTIEYDEVRYKFKWKNGVRVRVENPLALDVGHKTDRVNDPSFDGGDFRVGKRWCPNDTQPEHAVCGRAAGARLSNERQRAIKRAAVKLRTSRKW